MTLDLGEHARGLTSERMRHVHGLLHDYDPNLSLRRISDADPIMAWAQRQTPPRLYGVWEEGVGQPTDGTPGIISNWVLTIAEEHIDDRLFARVIAGDMKKHGVEERVANAEAFQKATQLSAQRKFLEQFEERRDQMMFIGQSKQSVLRMKINDEDVVIGDTVRSRRTHITK
jgi:hypothetical protein